MLVFDDSFEHEVVNDTDEVRVVLLLRFWHPALSTAEQRAAALQQVLQAKQDDRLRRCNPPLPDDSAAVTARGLQRSQCPACGSTGYESMRVRMVTDDNNYNHHRRKNNNNNECSGSTAARSCGQFHCVCGTPIVADRAVL